MPADHNAADGRRCHAAMQLPFPVATGEAEVFTLRQPYTPIQVYRGGHHRLAREVGLHAGAGTGFSFEIQREGQPHVQDHYHRMLMSTLLDYQRAVLV